jgi:hypothetical protein
MGTGYLKRVLRCVCVAPVPVLLALMTTGSLSAQTVSFISRRDFAAGREPHSVVVGDFNADGIPDLVVANYGSSNISVTAGQWGWDFSGGGQLRCRRFSSIRCCGGLQSRWNTRPGRRQQWFQQRFDTTGQWRWDLPDADELRCWQ